MFGKTKPKSSKMKKQFFYPEVHMVLPNFMLTGLQLFIESYNIFACSGILFNHESPLRGKNFVTKKLLMEF